MKPLNELVSLILPVLDFIQSYRFSSILCCFLSLRDNPGYMKPGYGDVRYKVYL